MFIVNIYWRQPMRTSVVDLRRTMSDTINRVAFEKERVVLERNGKDMLALVPMDDLALLEKLEDEADVKAARAALAEIKRTGEKPIPWEQVKAKLAAKRLREKKGLNAWHTMWSFTMPRARLGSVAESYSRPNRAPYRRPGRRSAAAGLQETHRRGGVAYPRRGLPGDLPDSR